MFTAPKILGTSRPCVTMSVKTILDEMNAASIANGGNGGNIVTDAQVFCELEDTSDPAYVDTVPEDRLEGNPIIYDTLGYVSQFFSEGVEGADYILTYVFTLSNEENITGQVRLMVRKYA